MKISELPPEIKEKALEYQRNASSFFYKNKDDIKLSFNWMFTEEGFDYWEQWHNKETAKKQSTDLQEQKHYDNSKGSLYQFCEDKQLNSYEFDIIKRVMRCRKKGNFIEDIDKTIYLLELYKKEYENTK
jgi:hypothetical protein